MEERRELDGTEDGMKIRQFRYSKSQRERVPRELIEFDNGREDWVISRMCQKSGMGEAPESRRITLTETPRNWKY